MNDITALYDEWCKNASADPDLIAELSSIRGSEEEINDRFYQNMSFGTAGLRGVIGAGTNRMNVYTVAQATQGLANYLKAEYDEPSVVIGFDSRIKSRLFAETAAGVLAANRITVYFYDKIAPTPMVSFGVRHFACKSGIVITASHNPSQYNGYKCYDERGYQMTDEAAQKTYDCIEKVRMFGGAKLMPFNDAVRKGIVRITDQSVYDKFYAEVLRSRVRPEITADSDLSIIYTPLNGTGSLPVRDILRLAGHKNVKVVPTQEKPDGNFPTCPFPNPEVRDAFNEALKMTADDPADLILATDPDCDRVGIAVRDKKGEYRLMTGNQVGCLLTEYIFSGLKEQGRLPKDPVLVKSIVTSDLASAIAKSYGGTTVELLTGFKYIGEYLTSLEEKKQEKRYILGFEESYGYLRGNHVHDKDAVVASMLIAEMACYVKKQGMDLLDYLGQVYEKYGYYDNSLFNFMFPSETGMEKMQGLMQRLRRNTPHSLAGLRVTTVADYAHSLISDLRTNSTAPILLPKSNVLVFSISDGSKVIVRPAGTEPKIKIYISVRADTELDAKATTDRLLADIKTAAGIEG